MKIGDDTLDLLYWGCHRMRRSLFRFSPHLMGMDVEIVIHVDLLQMLGLVLESDLAMFGPVYLVRQIVEADIIIVLGFEAENLHYY